MSFPIGEDGWHHPPARSRSHTVSGTQDDQHPTPRDTVPTFERPSIAHSGRRASLLASAFGSLLSPTTSRSESASQADSVSTGMTTPPLSEPPSSANKMVDHEHADELHDSVNAYTPLSRVWSLKARRSSWGPAPPPSSTSDGAGQGSVVAWINSQKEGVGQVDTTSTSAPTTSLFRRFSSGTQTRPTGNFMSDKGLTPLSPRAGESAVSDVPMAPEEEKARLGRSTNRRSSSSARRLSPMSEKLLRGHYEF